MQDAESLVFDGLDVIERRFMARAGEASYIVLKDRTNRKHEEGLGRLELSAEAVTPWLTPAPTPFVDEYDEVDLDPDELDDEQIMRAALRWLRDLATRNARGEPFCRFRVRLFAPKGFKVVDSGHFTSTDEAAEDDDDAGGASTPSGIEALRIPAPNFDAENARGAIKGLRALGDYYAQWGQIMLGSVGQLQGINNAMLGRLATQLKEARGQVDQLVASILENRVKELDVQSERLADEREGDARTALAREALGQLGQAANAFLASRGLSPETAELLGTLSGSPELLDALHDPGVRRLMKDPDNLRSLAEMLRQAAAQAQPGAAPQGSTTTPSPNEAPAQQPG